MKPKFFRITAALSAFSLSTVCLPALADDAAAQPTAADNNDMQEIVVTTEKTTRSSVALGGPEVQKLLIE